MKKLRVFIKKTPDEYHEVEDRVYLYDDTDDDEPCFKCGKLGMDYTECPLDGYCCCCCTNCVCSLDETKTI